MDFDAYLTKPIQREDLPVVVRALPTDDYQTIAEHEDIIP